MELKNLNPNVCNVLINNLHLMILFFKHVAKLSRKKNPKKHYHLGHFFIYKWACEVQLPCFLQGRKNDFSDFECLYHAIHEVKISEIFTKCSLVSILQDLMVICVKKILILVLVLEMVVLKHFWWKRSQELKSLIVLNCIFSIGLYIHVSYFHLL